MPITPRLEENPLWYRRKRTTVNAKLRQAIMDVLPLEMDQAKADLVLHTIWDMIKDSIIRGEECYIRGIGKFFKKLHAGRPRAHRIVGQEWRPELPRYRAVFYMNYKTRNVILNGHKQWRERWKSKKE